MRILISDTHHVLSLLKKLLFLLPAPWRTAYPEVQTLHPHWFPPIPSVDEWRQLAHGRSPPLSHTALEDVGHIPSFSVHTFSQVFPRMGWAVPFPPGAAPPGKLRKHLSWPRLTVRFGTQLQMGPSFQLRTTAHLQYVELALGSPSLMHLPDLPLTGWVPHATLHNRAVWDKYVLARARTFPSRLRRIWSIPWAPKLKETLWRLSVDGVRGANGVAATCPCGWQGEGDARLHTFWNCPVAAGIRAELERCLGSPILRPNLWLLDSPHPSHLPEPEVWQVVGLAALHAMHHGRKQLWRLHHQSQVQHGMVQLTIHQALGLSPRPPSLIARASSLAISNFWCHLADFAATTADDPWWPVTVLATHPFLTEGGCKVNHDSPS